MRGSIPPIPTRSEEEAAACGSACSYSRGAASSSLRVGLGGIGPRYTNGVTALISDGLDARFGGLRNHAGFATLGTFHLLACQLRPGLELLPASDTAEQ